MTKSTSTACTSNMFSTANIQISASDFIVHFRRPLKGGYNGSYGFDWLRDEYIYDILPITQLKNQPSRLYIAKDISPLKAEYTCIESKNVSRLLGEEYIPSWLGIFANSKTSKSKNASAEINKNGVNLHLLIEQDASKSALVSDDTILEFQTDCNLVKVTPSTIALKQLIAKGSKTETLTSTATGIKTKTIRKYENMEVKINIKSLETSILAVPIYVIAKKAGKPDKKVGLIMLYPNENVPFAYINPVKWLSAPNTKQFGMPANFQYYLKFRSFNQALVRAEIRAMRDMPIYKLVYDPKKETDKYNALANFKRVYSTSSYPRQSGENLKKAIIATYKILDKENINHWHQSKMNITHVIFTDYLVADNQLITLGEAMIQMNGVNIAWGNEVVLFAQGNTRLDTFAHELGHSLGLPHTFQSPPNSKHTFYQGYTDNLMDYEYFINRNGTSAGDNPFKKHMWALFKWQWGLLRQDVSIT